MCVFAYYALCIVFFELAHCYAVHNLASSKPTISHNSGFTSIEDGRIEKDMKII